MLTDEDLLFYYYDEELSDEERKRIDSALTSDLALADRYRTLCAELDAIAETDVAAGPERHAVWHQLVDELESTSRSVESRSRKGLHTPSFVWGLAAATLLALAVLFVIGRSTPQLADPTLIVEARPSAPSAQRVPTAFSRGLREHFRQSQAAIQSFDIDAADTRAELIGSLVEQNRMFERAATWHDFEDMARLLRAFERVLIQLDSGGLSPAEAEMLKSQLAFEFNVVLTKLAAEPSEPSETI
ncbi:MAG: hypothetical protein AAF417_00935 [Pseudomonadota bacterium]